MNVQRFIKLIFIMCLKQCKPFEIFYSLDLYVYTMLYVFILNLCNEAIIVVENKEVRIFERSNTENNTVAKENTQSMLQISLLLVLDFKCFLIKK